MKTSVSQDKCRLQTAALGGPLEGPLLFWERKTCIISNLHHSNNRTASYFFFAFSTYFFTSKFLQSFKLLNTMVTHIYLSYYVLKACFPGWRGTPPWSSTGRGSPRDGTNKQADGQTDRQRRWVKIYNIWKDSIADLKQL